MSHPKDGTLHRAVSPITALGYWDNFQTRGKSASYWPSSTTSSTIWSPIQGLTRTGVLLASTQCPPACCVLESCQLAHSVPLPAVCRSTQRAGGWGITVFQLACDTMSQLACQLSNQLAHGVTPSPQAFRLLCTGVLHGLASQHTVSFAHACQTSALAIIKLVMARSSLKGTPPPIRLKKIFFRNI